MSTEMQQTDQKKASRSREFTITLIIVVAATMLGTTGGFLIADREARIELFKKVAAISVGQPSTQAPAPAAEIKKPETPLANTPKKVKAAPASTRKPLLAEPSLVGAIDCLQQPDSASVSIEVGDVVLVRAEQLQNPDRIFFDLRDSRRTESTMEKLLALKTVPASGPLLSGVRLSQWESGAVRIVLDLKRPCEYNYRLSLEPSPHLVVELRAGAAGKPDSRN